VAGRLDQLRSEARDCRACPLWEHATQTVFGAGSPHASLLLVGEQPGDQEDRRGLPFVGPAGRLLDQAFEAAGIDRGEIYLTNAVKHFKWVAGEGGEPRPPKKPPAP
jgi:uracil-DNA glycosylase